MYRSAHRFYVLIFYRICIWSAFPARQLSPECIQKPLGYSHQSGSQFRGTPVPTIIIWVWISGRNTGKICRFMLLLTDIFTGLRLNHLDLVRPFISAIQMDIVTFYAHLNAFYPALAAYVKQKQYEMERWDLSLDLPPGLFKVKKGDLIALQREYGWFPGSASAF